LENEKIAWQKAFRQFMIGADVRPGGVHASNAQILAIKSCIGARQARATPRPTAQERGSAHERIIEWFLLISAACASRRGRDID
jgi:hypothetical protein